MDPFSFLNAAHGQYFEELYNQYLENPDSIEPSWRAFFQGFDFGQNGYGGAEVVADIVQLEKVEKEFRVVELIEGYRTRGHLFTQTNPVRDRRQYIPTLDIENFGLTENDLDTVFDAGNMLGIGPATLRNIIDHLKKVYCQSIGIEYMYIRDPEVRDWFVKKLNYNDNQPSLTPDQKKHILKKLNEAHSFETFLHTKYVGQKRFSVEGGESFIPAIDAIIEKATEMGVEQFVMGMAHRGRLNTLNNIFGKSAKDIFSEFEGKDYEQDLFDGDVKYHLGWTSERQTDTGKTISLNLAPNPSHLEAVNSVAEGITRAKLDRHFNGDDKKVLPILVHGDAAIAGQGIVYEIIQMAQLDGYKTGGTIHIVINNQIGFTTNYLDGRSSTYCTDVGKATLSPVLHVNADDAEAVVHACLFALDYRMTFGRDVFIDLLGYRKYGHNEGDEPRFTQPTLYKAISRHPNARDLYAQRLIEEGVIATDYVRKLEKEYKDRLEKKLEKSKKEEKTRITPFMQDEWEGFSRADEALLLQPVDTTFPLEKLDEVAGAITVLPEDKKFIRKIARLIDNRRTMYFEDDQLDWAMGELLAYGTLLSEGYDVRMSGQDCERGTFSHRHAVIKVEDSEEEVIPLNTLPGNGNGDFYIYNSLLSEYAAMGFEYGYAMARPQTLTLWEAQFGDFSNGAQIVIDQYLSSAEDKWKTQNGLVLLLPHGYEGQGAEHSSARMERFLQLCATGNMIAANVTTPANFFHLLRRQMKAGYRKPLVVFTPKSLLRHPKVTSTKAELAEGGFRELIDDPAYAKASAGKPAEVKKLIFCSGKFYYDLLDKKEKDNHDDVALVRLEQLYPLPEKQIQATIKKYKNAKEIIWAQEEPYNMGAWTHLLLQMDTARDFKVCSQAPYASPAAGSAARAMQRHREVIDSVFG